MKGLSYPNCVGNRGGLGLSGLGQSNGVYQVRPILTQRTRRTTENHREVYFMFYVLIQFFEEKSNFTIREFLHGSLWFSVPSVFYFNSI